MNFNVVLTERDLDVVSAGLSKLTLETALPTFESLRAQVSKQVAESKQSEDFPQVSEEN